MAYLARNDQATFDRLFANALSRRGIQAQPFAHREQALRWLGISQELSI